MTSALDDAPAADAGVARDGPASPPPSARTTTTPREVWSRSRTPLVLLLLLGAVSVLIAVASGGVNVGYLDPEAADPSGARAITRLLEDRGIEVTRRVEPQVRRDTTLVIAAPDLVDPSLLAEVVANLGPGSDVVLVGAGEDTVRELEDAGLDVSVAGTANEDDRRPACEAGVATVAGVARTGGFLYDAPDASFRCYASDGEASLVVFEPSDGPRVSLVGSGDFLTNGRLDEHGNAALALGLMSRHDSVDWVYPRLDEVGLEPQQERGLGELLPERLQWALLQLAIAVVLLALWRARRLGPVVSEELPVVVRAAEAVEGRARLYEGGGARDRAAAVLRGAARDRLVHVLGLGRDTSREAVCLAVADRSTLSTDAAELLLYGGPPGDDAELVRLSAALDSLEREVRTT